MFDYLAPYESIEELSENEENELLLSDDGVGYENMVTSVESGFDIGILYKKLATLTPREEEVLSLRYGIGFDHEYTLDEIGQKFYVTRERVRQIEVKAMRKIRRRYGMKDKDKD